MWINQPQCSTLYPFLIITTASGSDLADKKMSSAFPRVYKQMHKSKHIMWLFVSHWTFSNKPEHLSCDQQHPDLLQTMWHSNYSFCSAPQLYMCCHSKVKVKNRQKKSNIFSVERVRVPTPYWTLHSRTIEAHFFPFIFINFQFAVSLFSC